jgi:hypothetical protein
MNIKAERIEQMVQLINRNLQLIYSGQYEGRSFEQFISTASNIVHTPVL